MSIRVTEVGPYWSAIRSQVRRLEGAFYRAAHIYKVGQVIGDDRVAEHQLHLATLGGVRTVDYVIAEFVFWVPNTTRKHRLPPPGSGQNRITGCGIHPLNQHPVAEA